MRGRREAVRFAAAESIQDAPSEHSSSSEDELEQKLKGGRRIHWLDGTKLPGGQKKAGVTGGPGAPASTAASAARAAAPLGAKAVDDRLLEGFLAQDREPKDLFPNP